MSQDTLDEIVGAHSEFNGRLDKVSEKFGVPKYRVSKIWNGNGLKATRKGTLSNEDIETVIAAHLEFDGNISEAGNALGLPYARIRGIWKDNDLKSKRKTQVSDGYGRLGKEKYDEIVASYDSVNGVAIKAAELCGTSYFSVRRIWNKEGLKTVDSRELSQDTLDELVGAHSEFKGSLNEVSEKFGVPKYKVSKVWNENGLKAARKDSLSDEERKSILTIYKEAKGSPTKASKLLNISDYKIRRVWLANDLDVVRSKYSRSIKELSKEDLELIINTHKDCDGVLSTAASKLNISRKDIKQVWNDNSLEIKKYQRVSEFEKLTRSDLGKIIKSYDESGKLIDSASELTGFNKSTIKRVWGKNNLQPRRPVKEKSIYGGVGKEGYDKIIESYKLSKDADITAKETGFSEFTVRKYAKRAGIYERKKRTPASFNVSEKDYAKIVAAYDIHDGDLAAATRFVGISAGAVKNVWLDNALPILSGESILTARKPITAEQRKRVINAHKESDGNVKKASSLSRVGMKTVRDIWRRNDLTDYGSLGKKVYKQVMRVHKKHKGVLNSASKDLDISASRIKRVWMNERLPIARKPVAVKKKKSTKRLPWAEMRVSNRRKKSDVEALTVDKLDELKQAHKKHKGRLTDIIDETNLNAPTIENYCKLFDLNLR